MTKQAKDLQVGDTIELHRQPLVGNGSGARRNDHTLRLDSSYEVVEVLKPEPGDEDWAILVDVKTPYGVKTVDCNPHTKV